MFPYAAPANKITAPDRLEQVLPVARQAATAMSVLPLAVARIPSVGTRVTSMIGSVGRAGDKLGNVTDATTVSLKGRSATVLGRTIEASAYSFLNHHEPAPLAVLDAAIKGVSGKTPIDDAFRSIAATAGKVADNVAKPHFVPSLRPSVATRQRTIFNFGRQPQLNPVIPWSNMAVMPSLREREWFP